MMSSIHWEKEKGWEVGWEATEVESAARARAGRKLRSMMV